MHQDKDRGGKWMIANFGEAILRLGGLGGFTSCEHQPVEVVAPRRTLDGLFKVTFPDQPEPTLVLIDRKGMVSCTKSPPPGALPNSK